MRKVVLILLGLAVVSASQAAVLTVTNTDDSGPGSLRDALAIAQPGDEIQFDPSLDGLPIVLTSGQPLSCDQNVTVTGRGPENTVIDANASTRALLIGAASVMKVSGLTIRNGEGGGIYLDGGTAELVDTVISDNHSGYAIYARNGSLTVTDSTVSNNSGSAYGIFQHRGVLAVTNTTVTGNWRGLYSYDGVATLTLSAIGGNEAEGVFAVQTSVELVNTIVDGNGGNGIFNHGGNLTLVDSTVSNNFAANGAGIWNGGSLNVSRSTISGNSALYDGGGLYNRSDAGVLISNSTICSNSAGRRGGGAFDRVDRAPVLISSSTIAGNTAGEDGGGLFTENGDLVLSNSIVADHPLGGDCGVVAPRSDGNNLDSDDSCGLDRPTDQPATDPMLGPLEESHGPSRTRVPLEGSPAIDHGRCESVTDQRGVPRPLDGDHDNVAICDIGAVEFVPYELRLVGPMGESIVIPAD